ncbi:helix-turn-helix transcriptional regulator [Rhodoligotrophos defluvii]|uniref:helix-turn-helix transcriptional regulator n=1 Tax=Rhodoligotrophos defluvii TaxID=2561934 RepID=UPI0010C9379C|nr:helix-turn-helix transcriptional regulator [Rhodoligotrophos defluvii]
MSKKSDIATQKEPASGPPATPNERASESRQLQENRALRAFAHRLTEKVAAKGWTQAEFARRLSLQMGREIDRRSVNGYFLGKHRPSHNMMAGIAKVLNQDIDQLYPGYLEVPGEVQSMLGVEPRLEFVDKGGGKATLNIRQEVSLSAALKVIHIITEELEKDERADDGSAKTSAGRRRPHN